jgi:hypothetical protein
MSSPDSAPASAPASAAPAAPANSDAANSDAADAPASAIMTNAAARMAAASAFATTALTAIGSNPLQTGMFIALAIMSAVLIWYIIFKVNQKQDEIASTHILTNNYMKPLNMLTNQAVDPMTMPLRNYYIKTAINCCCLGEWKNNYVDLAPLKSAIADGYRCLDFEIYSENDKPVVAASTKPSVYYKETYNSLPFSDVITTIKNTLTTKSPNGTDPLFINLRIKSNNTKIIDGIVAAINDQFGDMLLGPDHNYLYGGNNLGQSLISDFMGKVIIMADISNPLCTDKDLPLFQIINFGSNSPFLHQLQYEMGVKNTPDMDALIDHNKKFMSIVLPDLPFNENINFNIAKSYGCQFIGMMPQLKDINLDIYNKAFDDADSAFILKPPELCYQPVVIETPPPQNPALSFAGRNYSTDYASWSV